MTMSFPYMRGSHCSIIYRWHTISQKSNRTQITAQVLDKHVVLHVQFEGFLLEEDAILFVPKEYGWNYILGGT